MSQTKRLLSYARQGDFAHPGEIEAIQLAMAPIAKHKTQRLLDVGCGLGGTAHYLQQRGWGEIVGIDVDNDAIQYAQQHYKDASFIHGDILQANDYFATPFNVICCFSSFFCFSSQQNALEQFAQIGEKNCTLMIFDYSRPALSAVNDFFPWSKTESQFHPIYLPELRVAINKSRLAL